MRRTDLVEIHDHPRFPALLRDLVTDALESLWEFGNSYKPILAPLTEALSEGSGDPVRIIDLCSGGGGPWLALARQIRDQYKTQCEVRLTDKYPNIKAFQRMAARSGSVGTAIGFEASSVDATSVPVELKGFRTIFSSFHHLGPADARKVLLDAVRSRQGIGVFEVPRRGARTLLALCFTPLLVLLITPRMRPFRWSRIFWTYLLPVVPFVIGYDGLVSCFRAYSHEELREMVRGIDEYSWRIGQARSGFLPVDYMIGTPAKSDS